MIDLTTVAAKLTTLRSNLNTTKIDGSSAAELGPLIGAFDAAQLAVNQAIAAAETTLANVKGVGGVVAGGDPETMAAEFVTNAWVACQDTDLTDLSNFLSRIGINIEITLTSSPITPTAVPTAAPSSIQLVGGGSIELVGGGDIQLQGN